MMVLQRGTWLEWKRGEKGPLFLKQQWRSALRWILIACAMTGGRKYLPLAEVRQVAHSRLVNQRIDDEVNYFYQSEMVLLFFVKGCKTSSCSDYHNEGNYENI